MAVVQKHTDLIFVYVLPPQSCLVGYSYSLLVNAPSESMFLGWQRSRVTTEVAFQRGKCLASGQIRTPWAEDCLQGCAQQDHWAWSVEGPTAQGPEQITFSYAAFKSNRQVMCKLRWTRLISFLCPPMMLGHTFQFLCSCGESCTWVVASKHPLPAWGMFLCMMPCLHWGVAQAILPSWQTLIHRNPYYLVQRCFVLFSRDCQEGLDCRLCFIPRFLQCEATSQCSVSQAERTW